MGMSGPHAKIKIRVLSYSVPLAPDLSRGENKGTILIWLSVACLCVFDSVLGVLSQPSHIILVLQRRTEAQKAPEVTALE